MAQRREVSHVRTARERVSQCDPVRIAKHRPLSTSFALEDVAVQAAARLAPVLCLRAQLSLQNRRYERVRVDLAVWVAQGHTDLLTTVLEDVDVLHVGKAAQLARAIAPHLDEVANVVDAL